MGQKINPIGFRLSIFKNWSSKWYADKYEFLFFVNEDLIIRNFLNLKFKNSHVGNIIIKRFSKKDIRIIILSSRPGLIIGKNGNDIILLKDEIQLLIKKKISLFVEEIKKPYLDAKIISNNIANQLEKRVMFRRVIKNSMKNIIKLKVLGIKIMLSGRLNGVDIARKEWYSYGRIPLHTLKAIIDYGFSEAKTIYGMIGVKVWIYKGNYLNKTKNVISKK